MFNLQENKKIMLKTTNNFKKLCENCKGEEIGVIHAIKPYYNNIPCNSSV